GGRKGLERVRSQRYDLIVSDIRMPESGGEDFYRDAVALDAALTNRFIFITGDTANREAYSLLADAGVPIIEKPFAPTLLLDAIRRVATPAPARKSRFLRLKFLVSARAAPSRPRSAD